MTNKESAEWKELCNNACMYDALKGHTAEQQAHCGTDEMLTFYRFLAFSQLPSKWQDVKKLWS